MDMKDELASVNMELRMITLELMKIANKQGKDFKDVAIEYIQNAVMLKAMLENCSFEKVECKSTKSIDKELGK